MISKFIWKKFRNLFINDGNPTKMNTGNFKAAFEHLAPFYTLHAAFCTYRRMWFGGAVFMPDQDRFRSGGSEGTEKFKYPAAFGGH